MNWLTFEGLFLSEDSLNLDLDFCSATMHSSLSFFEVCFRLYKLLILAILYLLTGIKTDHSLGKWEGSKIFACNHRLSEVLRIYEKINWTQAVPIPTWDQAQRESHQPTDRTASSLLLPQIYNSEPLGQRQEVAGGRS